MERGYDGVSINDVARQAKATKALVFYYFSNKQELFETVLDRYYQAQFKALMAAVDPAGGERERIHAGIDAYLDFIEKDPGYARLIQREVCSSSRNLEKITQYMQPLYQWGQTAFGHFLSDKGPLSKRHYFISIFGMIINYYTYSPVLEPLWGTDPLGEPALAERRRHLHIVLGGILDSFLNEKDP